MSDRIAGVLLTVIALAYVVTAGSYEVGFGDPLGPTTFPKIIGIPAVLLAASLVPWPGPRAEWASWPQGRNQVIAVVTLLGYALLLERVGFVASTFLLLAVMAVLMGARTWQAIGLGAVGSPLMFVAFDRGLDLPLPLLGSWFG